MALTHNIWIDGTSGWSYRADSEREIARAEADIAPTDQAIREGPGSARDAAMRHSDGGQEKRILEQERGGMAPAIPSERGHAASRPALEEAHTDSGVYRGEVVGVTNGHVLQQIGQALILHVRDRLSRTPPVGDSVIVQYLNGRGAVKDAPLRARTRLMELGR
jgi:hypothetical protein